MDLKQIAKAAAKSNTYMAQKFLEAIARKWAKEGACKDVSKQNRKMQDGVKDK